MESFYTGLENAKIVDPELRSILGTNVTLQFNIAGYSVPKGKALDSLIIGEGPHFSSRSLVVRAKIGKGLAYFTTYHNSPNLSAEGKKILEVLVLKQIADNEG
jgi:hypothetical protein